MSLADASTAGTPRPPGQGTDLLAGAIYDWQRAAIDTAHPRATNRRDLFAAARAAGLLTGLSQALLQAHADVVGPRRLVAATDAELRRTGLAWNTAHTCGNAQRRAA